MFLHRACEHNKSRPNSSFPAGSSSMLSQQPQHSHSRCMHGSRNGVTSTMHRVGLSIGAMAVHFGLATNLKDVYGLSPADAPVVLPYNQMRHAMSLSAIPTRQRYHVHALVRTNGSLVRSPSYSPCCSLWDLSLFPSSCSCVGSGFSATPVRRARAQVT